MKMRAIATVLLLLAPCSVAADSTHDYAFAVPINGVGADALYRLQIPPAVYTGSTFGDLRDLRVFNGAGEVVPHAFRPLESVATHQPEPINLPLFALRGPSGTNPDDLDIVVVATNVKFRLRTSSPTRSGEQNALLGYLIDISAMEKTFSELTLDWDALPGGYVGAVNVEASDDLKRWKRISTDAPLVNLAQAGQQLEQKSVALQRIRTKYLRLTWPAGTNAVRLKSVIGQPADEVTPRKRAWMEISAVPDPDARGDYLADLGGLFPVDRLKLQLPQENAIAPIQIFSRNEPGNAWQRVTRTVTYRLHQNGQDISNPEIVVAPRMRRYWLFRVDQQGGGIGEGSVHVQAGWIGREIVFAARGAGPFMLAYGNGKAVPNALAIQTLVPGWGKETAPQISLATSGEVQTLAGAAAARQRIDMKKVGLWAALFAGVAFLAFMAWQISRQLQKDNG